MAAVDDPVLPFRLIVYRRALPGVDAEPHSRLDKDAVGLVAHDGDRRHVGEREIIEATQRRAVESATRRLRKVVVFTGLVVDGGDPTVRVGAELILRGGVGVPARI